MEGLCDMFAEAECDGDGQKKSFIEENSYKF